MSTVADDSSRAESYEEAQQHTKVTRRIKRFAIRLADFGDERKKVCRKSRQAREPHRMTGQLAEHWSALLNDQPLLQWREVSSLKVGTAQYSLRRPTEIQFSLSEGLYTATIEHLTDERFAGRSEDKLIAEKKLLEAIHTEFQRLHKTQPMQRSVSDATVWQQLHALIDDAAFRKQQKIVHQVLGYIKSIEPAGMELEEVGGAVWKLPTDALAGAEWSQVAIGDWLECAVVKVINAPEIYSAAFLVKVKPPRVASDEEIEKFYANLPPADFPNAE